jgi:threonine dehydratase
VRGALNALLVARERGDHRPVITASAGNHAQGVAWAARHLGLAASTVVPEGAPATKVRGAAALGARVITFGSSYEEAEEHARGLAEARGHRFLAAFDDPDVIAGQGTVAWELLAAAPDVVLVPIGGGGLAAGMALVLKPRGVRVVGVQVEGVDGMARALDGRPPLAAAAETVADGVRVRRPGRITQRLCAALLDDVLVISEREVRETMVSMAAQDRIVAEGAGALAPAAMHLVSGRRKVAVVSGGNLDLERLGHLIAHRARPGVAASGAPAA